MGSWSECIMGGDGPYDVEHYFEEEFSTRKPTSEESVALIEKISGVSGMFEPSMVMHVVGYLAITRGAPMSAEFRALVLEGIDDEDTSHWTNPELRAAKLAEFRAIVEAYPEQGAVTAMPVQEGLMDVISGISRG